MALKLKKSPIIWKLAKDLGLKPIEDPVSDILAFCDKRIKLFLKDFSKCATLGKLLEIVASKVGTRIVEIHDDNELRALQQEYLAKEEQIFAILEDELSENVYGITIKLLNHAPWEPQFISIIDCREDKAARSYFTKWHEIAHLLILTDQLRLSFRRTQHKSPSLDPEEAMVDLIAGTFGFYEPIIGNKAKGDISFEAIEGVCAKLCSEASYHASLIGVVKAWKSPCMLLRCMPALNRKEQALLEHCNFDFADTPFPVLRAVNVTLSIAMPTTGFRIYKNMRVPESSIIHGVFNGEIDYAEAVENLSWWEASDGSRLPACPIYVRAKLHGGVVFALVSPIS